MQPRRRSVSFTIAHHHVEIDGGIMAALEMGDVLSELAKRIQHRSRLRLEPSTLGSPVGGPDDPSDAASLYPRRERFLRPDDIVIAETGTVSMGPRFTRLPKGGGLSQPDALGLD